MLFYLKYNSESIFFYSSCLQQQSMKINFDYIFSAGLSSSLSFQQTKVEDKSPPRNTHLSSNIIESQLTERRYEHHTDTNKNKPTAAERMKVISRLIEEKEIALKRKGVFDIEAMTNKLYRPTPCCKKECSEFKKIKDQKDLEESFPLSLIKKSFHSKSNGNIKDYPTHERLFQMSKIINKQKDLQAQLQQQPPNEIPRILKTKRSLSYLQSYVPFFDRLESEVSRSQEKARFYQKNPQLAVGEYRQLFQPTLIPGKYRQKVKSRFNKQHSRDTKNTTQIQVLLNSSISTSFCSLDRSVEIINCVEEHFFRRVLIIFAGEGAQGNRPLTITPQSISLLSDVEFRILQNLIIEVEQRSINASQFEDMLRQYYHSLPSYQKLELRSHQTSRKRVSNPYKPPQPIKAHKNKSIKQSIYHKKLQNFV